jgi:7-carboxy-7-deazaguanine synthase
MSAPAAVKPQQTHPVIEVFGPTVQGEGPEAGTPCYFVRLGGCDYRCSWCDSMYAVEPAEVREHSTKLTPEQIAARVVALPGGARWVILSGGNPALHHLSDLVDQLHAAGYRVAVETQGSVFRPWLSAVDRLVISPKGPSSGMETERHGAQFEAFMARLDQLRFATAHPMRRDRVALKIVVADDADYEWAAKVFGLYPRYDHHLSVCTPQLTPVKGRDDAADKLRAEGIGLLRRVVCDRYRWLCEKVAHDPRMGNVRVLPQLHVLAWGTERGR